MDVIRQAKSVGIPEETLEVFRVEFYRARAFSLSLLGEYESIYQGPEGRPRRRCRAR